MPDGVVSLFFFIPILYFVIKPDHNVVTTLERLRGEERTGHSHQALNNKRNTMVLCPGDYTLTSLTITGK